MGIRKKTKRIREMNTIKFASQMNLKANLELKLKQ